MKKIDDFKKFNAVITEYGNGTYKYENNSITFYFDTYQKLKSYIRRSKKCSTCGNIVDY